MTLKEIRKLADSLTKEDQTEMVHYLCGSLGYKKPEWKQIGMVSQKFGVLSVIASTGGLKFIGKDQKWMNPPNKATPEEVEYLKKMRSKKVCITFNDKGEYVSCGITATDNKDIPTHPETDNKSAPQQAKTGQIQRINR